MSKFEKLVRNGPLWSFYDLSLGQNFRKSHRNSSVSYSIPNLWQNYRENFYFQGISHESYEHQTLVTRVEVTIRFAEILRPFCFESDKFFGFDNKLANSEILYEILKALIL